jgi:hypothetical protein
MRRQIYKYIALALLITSLSGCDKNFEKINTNPTLATTIDPSFIFANAQLGSAIETYTFEMEIVQQIITPFTGTPSGGNHNVENDAAASIAFDDFYGGPVKYLTDVISKTKDDPNRSNLYNMARIWKAYIFQVLVDTYGDVPYFDAGKAYIDGTNLPKYDDSKAIYADIIKELEEATAGLDASKAIEGNDLFYSGDVSKWKKLGNSLLLRVGMRLTKYDAAMAQQVVQTALDPANGGVMESNSDNAYLAFNSTYSNPSVRFVNAERANMYVGKPFVDYLQMTNDPRLHYIAVKYEIPSNPIDDVGHEDTVAADQQGMPYGYDDATISTAPGYPGKIGTAWKYSQLNRRTLGKIDAPAFFVTYSQTQLLLAEAAERGWAAGNVMDLYIAGVKGHMDQMAQYDPSAIIPLADQNAYLAANPFIPGDAIEQINTQYWIASFLNGSEVWANFRRSGFPALVPNPYPSADPTVKGGFIHRLTYPSREASVNTENYNAAVANMGPDNLATRVFWDK